MEQSTTAKSSASATVSGAALCCRWSALTQYSLVPPEPRAGMHKPVQAKRQHQGKKLQPVAFCRYLTTTPTVRQVGGWGSAHERKSVLMYLTSQCASRQCTRALETHNHWLHVTATLYHCCCAGAARGGLSVRQHPDGNAPVFALQRPRAARVAM